MKINAFDLAGWIARLVLVVGLMVSSAAAALAFDVSGTVTNSTARTGRVFMYLQQQFGGDTGLGVSVPAPASGTSFTIRGVPNGTYILKAFVDGSGTGRLHANDPIWSSAGIITINNGNHTLDPNTTVNFTTLPSVSPVTPSKAQILPGDNGAFVGWNEPTDINGNTIADSYKVYYSTTSSTPYTTHDGVITVPASDQTFALFHYANGTTLNVQVTALVGTTESAASTVATKVINPPAAGYSISGTINLSGISPPTTANLYIALVNRAGKGGPVAAAYVATPPQSSNNFIINTNSTNAPPGTYSLYAFIDMNNDGRIGSGDVMPSDQQAPMVTVNGSNITGQTINLIKSNSAPFLNTSHWQDTNTPPNESYNVVVGAKSSTETLANITVNCPVPSTSGLPCPIDLGLTSWGQFQAWLNVNNNRPQPADAYNVTINYANGVAAETLNLNPTVVLDSFATSLAPAGTYPYASITNPTTTNFTWVAPATPPTLTPYTYSLWATIPGFPGNSNLYNNMPSSTLAQSVSGLTYTDGVSYSWTVSVQDAAGNQAQKSVALIYTSAPAITSFTPASAVPGTVVTLTGINFDPTPANNTVTFGCGATAQATTASATQLTVVLPTNACTGSLLVSANGKTSSYSTAQLNVLRTITTTGVVFNTNPSTYSQGVTFTANVTPAAATGTIQFFDGATSLGTTPVTAGSASLSFSNLSVGTHSITAVYSGDASYYGSTSAVMALTVNGWVKIGSSGNFLTLQAAITAAADTNVLLLRDTRFAEDLIVNRTLPFTITLNGGLTSDFITPVGSTSVRTLKIQQGRVNAVRLVVKPD